MGEMIAFLFVLLFQLGDFLLALVSLGISDLAVRNAGGLRKTDEAKRIVHFIFHVILGTGLGAGSLLLFPKPFIATFGLQVLSLVTFPVLVALAFHLVGKSLIQHNKRATRMERFSGAFEFAFFYCLVRFLFTK